MNPKTLIIYNYQTLYEILNEIKDHLNFEILNINQKDYEKLDFSKYKNYLIISSVNSFDLKNCFILDNLPVKFQKLIQIININFLKNNFANQSEIIVGKYKLDTNSRRIFFKNEYLSLTEKESDMIIFIKSNNNVTIKELQNNVWGYSSNLETHTVETHIYRLRKKMKEKFNDSKFILNTQQGYKIV